MSDTHAIDRKAMDQTGAIWIGTFRNGREGNLTFNSKDLGELPDFGHLDFEEVPPAERFRKFATKFSKSLFDSHST